MTDAAAYGDRWISCDGAGIAIRGYYFPWGTKHISYQRLRGLRRVEMTAMRGKMRLWGTSNFRYWASLDPKRPEKSVAFVLDLGRNVHPFITPDDPDAFASSVEAHTGLRATDAGGSTPYV
ncbi:MAG: PH domain-containing protein [Acidimicrobiales bacterium]